MKRIVFVFLALALVLTACGAPTPVTIVITATPNDVVVPTDMPAPTDEPVATDVPAPTDEPIAMPTDTPEAAAPTNTSAPVAAAPTKTTRPATTSDVFADITRDADSFSLRCAAIQGINFSLTSTNSAITKVFIYYRVVAKDSTLKPGAPVNNKEMTGDKKGHFSLFFQGVDVKDDLRLANGWFEYQFVGVNKTGNVVGRSDLIQKEVTFTLECP
jgi:hypothetical protein